MNYSILIESVLISGKILCYDNDIVMKRSLQIATWGTIRAVFTHGPQGPGPRAAYLKNRD
jgi:hypothetical protein